MNISAYERPSTRKLLTLVIPHAARKWYELGAMLLDEDQENELELIQLNFAGDIQKCCSQMLLVWKQSHPTASWYILVEALRSPGVELNAVAFNIEKCFTDVRQESQVENPSSAVVLKAPYQRDYSDINFEEYKNVSSAFSKLFTTVQEAIMHLDHDHFQMIRNSCVSQAEEPLHGLFKQAQNSHHLFGILADNKPYCNWMRINFLEVIASAYGKQSLENLVQRYSCAIFSKQLGEVWGSISHISTRHKFYTELKGRFDIPDPEKITVWELIKMEPDLAKQIELHIAEVHRGSLVVTWLIPVVKLYQTYLSCLAIPQQLRMDVSLQCGSWVAYLPQCVLQELHKKHGSASYSTLLIGYYHGLLLQVVDSDLLTDEMCSVGLLTVDEQIVIDSGCSMYQRNRLLLEHVRRMNVHALLEFCKLLHNIWPQIGMQLITALKSNVSSQAVKLKSSVEISAQDQSFEPSVVLTEFLHLFDQIVELLHSCGCMSLVKQCKGLMASELHQISLFTDEQIKDLSKSTNALSVLWKLNACLTWSDYSILRKLIGFSTEAKKLLSEFDSRLDTTKPIFEYPVPQFSATMIPTDLRVYTLLAVRFNQELQNYTLENVCRMQSMLAGKCEITQHCLQLLAVKNKPTVLYWTIPASVVGCINITIPKHMEYFNGNGILEIVVYPKLVFNLGSEVCFGPMIFIGDNEDTSRKSIDVVNQAKETENKSQIKVYSSTTSYGIINDQVKLLEASEKAVINAKKCSSVYLKLFNEHFRPLWNKKQDRCLQVNTVELKIFQIIDDMFEYTKFISENSITYVDLDNILDVKQLYETEERLCTSIKDVLYSSDIEKMAKQQSKLKINGTNDDLTVRPKNKKAHNKILINKLFNVTYGHEDLKAVYDSVSLYVDAYEKYADSIIAIIDLQIKL